jgi:hypothetical protein
MRKIELALYLVSIRLTKNQNNSQKEIIFYIQDILSKTNFDPSPPSFVFSTDNKKFKCFCIPISLQNALQINELTYQEDHTSFGYTNDQFINLCQLNNVFVVSLTKHFESWRKKAFDKILQSTASLVIIGKKKVEDMQLPLLEVVGFLMEIKTNSS